MGPRRLGSEERPLTRQMRERRPDDRTAGPEKQPENQDQLFWQVLQAAEPAQQARLNKLTASEQQLLIDHLVETVTADELQGNDAAERVGILVELAQSWLDDHEQARRRRPR